MTTTPAPYILFGSTTPWLPPPWTTTDDRVRGGASQSTLSALPHNAARFHGHLDTSTLGGAGFASQFSPPRGRDGGGWDLSGYDGVEVHVGEGDGMVYTLILKDEEPGAEGEGGRVRAGVSWEVDFRVGEGEGEGEGGVKVFVPWEGFKATYRGKKMEDAGELKTGEVRKVGVMMRSYFGKQEGDFSVVLRSISARKTVAGDEQRDAADAVGRVPLRGGSTPATTATAGPGAGKERGTGWLDWFRAFGASSQRPVAGRR